MYYPTMSSLIYKKKKGREYAYWVRSARINGKPRIVEQVYLGPRDRFLEETKQAYTRGTTPGPCPLKRVRSHEFGASALLWQWAQELGLSEIIDRHVPAPPRRRRTQLSVGQYLVIAAINRAIDPQSKRAMYDEWYQHSVISRLWKVRPSELNSQRFWDHMDQVEPGHIEAIQYDLLVCLSERFELGGGTILYDTTNYFSFIDSFNDRTELAQRGKNKQKRMDLRQLSLALFEDEATSLPLYHQCYEGNRHDARHFPFAWEGLLQGWMKGMEREPEQLTLVFDGGNVSKANLRQLDHQAIHYVTAVPNSWLPELLEVELEEYQKLELPGTKHLKVYRTERKLWGGKRTVLVVFSPSLYCKQRATMNREQYKADERLQELAAAIDRWRQSRRGKGHAEGSVRQKIRNWTAREHLREYLEVDLEIEAGKVVGLQWRWDLEKKRAVQRRHLGKRIVVTDCHDWDDVSIVVAYRRLTRTEHLFRISKSQPGLWWPMFHWTDSKIRVHALYCFLALLLMAILRLRLQETGNSIRVDRAMDRLKRIEETLVVYTNGAVDRVLDMDEDQRRIAEDVGLIDLARELGTTVLAAE